MSSVPTAAESKHRFQSLDGLRGIAALFVVLLHVEWASHLTDNNLVQHGYVAVDLFFILSGFVMSSNYLSRINNLREVRNFIGLRFFRLYPLHLAMLAAFVCLECVKLAAHSALSITPGSQAPFTGGNSVSAVIANIFLINGLHVLDIEGWNGPSWSISCEFVAYIVFSAVTITGLFRNRAFIISVALAAGAVYAGLAFARGTLNVTIDWGILRCLAGFFIGVVVFQMKGSDRFSQPPRWIGNWSIAAVVAIFTTLIAASGPLLVLVIPLFAITISVLRWDQGFVAGVLRSPPLQFLGRISYSIYMVHFFLVVCLLVILKRIFVLPTVAYSARSNPIMGINPWIGDLLVLGLVAGTIATSAATYAFIEEPGRRFGRRLMANRVNRSATVACQ